MASIVPDGLQRVMKEVHGKAAEAWLEAFPPALAEFEKRWELSELTVCAGLSYNFVASARQVDGSAVVLKAGVPSAELRCEMEALGCWDGVGAVRLLEADPDRGFMLLEAARAERDLSTVTDDDAACRIAARCMSRLWRSVAEGHGFPDQKGWLAGFDRLRRGFGGTCGPLPKELVDEAEGRGRELVASAAPPVLLHGDLHHANVLASSRDGWLAIDPKGIMGDPAMEPYAFCHNHLAEAEKPEARLDRRLAIFAEELGFELARLRAWTFTMLVLSACWTLEDHGRVDEQALRWARSIRGGAAPTARPGGGP